MRQSRNQIDLNDPRTFLSQSDLRHYFRTQDPYVPSSQTPDTTNQYNRDLPNPKDLERQRRLQLRDQEKFRRQEGIQGSAYQDDRDLLTKSLQSVQPNQYNNQGYFQNPSIGDYKSGAGNTEQRNYQLQSEGDLFSKLGKHESGNDMEKKRRYKEELDEMVKMKNKPVSKAAQKRLESLQGDINKENRPLNTSVQEDDWERKRRIAEEAMKSILGKEKENPQPRYSLDEGNSIYTDYEDLRDYHPYNPGTFKEEPSITQDDKPAVITPPVQYDQGFSYNYNIPSADNYDNNKQPQEVKGYEYGGREEVEKPSDWEKKMRYKQELDAQLEEQKRKQGAAGELSRKGSQRVEVPAEKPEKESDSGFFLFKAEEGDKLRAQQRNLEMQKYAEELKKQVQEKEEQKKREKLLKKERDARERLELEREAEKNSKKTESKPKIVEEHVPTKAQEEVRDIQDMPQISQNEDVFASQNTYPDHQEPSNWQGGYSGRDGYPGYPGTGQSFYNPHTAASHSNGFYKTDPNFGKYDMSVNRSYPGNQQGLHGNSRGFEQQGIGYQSLGQPWHGMYGPPPGAYNPIEEMRTYHQMMQQLMKDRLRIETMALQEKLVFEQYRNKMKEIEIGQLQSEQGANQIKSILNYPVSYEIPDLFDQNPSSVGPIQNNQYQSKHNENYSGLGHMPMQTPLRKSQKMLNDSHYDKSLGSNVNKSQSLLPYQLEKILDHSVTDLRQSLPSSQTNYQITAEEAEQSFLKDMGILQQLHKVAFQLGSPEKEDKEEGSFSQSNSKSKILPSQSIHERSVLTQRLEERPSASHMSGKDPYNPMSQPTINQTDSSMLQYSESRPTVQSMGKSPQLQSEGDLMYNVDNICVMMTPLTEVKGVVKGADVTPQVMFETPNVADFDSKIHESDEDRAYEDSKSLQASKQMKKTANFPVSNATKKDGSTSKAGNPEVSVEEHYTEDFESLHSKTGLGRMSFSKMESSRAVDESRRGGDILVRNKRPGAVEESKVDESQISMKDSTIPMGTMEQKIEAPLMDMHGGRSLILAEDEEDEDAEYDTSEIREFKESHEKMMQEIRAEMLRSEEDWYGKAVDQNKNTESELMDIVNQARKAVGMVDKAASPSRNDFTLSHLSVREGDEGHEGKSFLSKNWNLKFSKDMSQDQSHREDQGNWSSKLVQKFEDRMTKQDKVLSMMTVPSLDSLDGDKAKEPTPLKGKMATSIVIKEEDPMKMSFKEGETVQSLQVKNAEEAEVNDKSAIPVDTLRDLNCIESISDVDYMGRNERYRAMESKKVNDEIRSESGDDSQDDEGNMSDGSLDMKMKEIKMEEIKMNEDPFGDNERRDEIALVGDSRIDDESEIRDEPEDNREAWEIKKNLLQDKKTPLEIIHAKIQGKREQEKVGYDVAVPQSENLKKEKNEARNQQDNDSKDVTEMRTENKKDFKGEVSDSVAEAKKTEGRIAQEKRSKNILSKLEKLLDGWSSEEEQGDVSESVEIEKKGHSRTDSEGLFRPIGNRRSMSKRYTDDEEA